MALADWQALSMPWAELEVWGALVVGAFAAWWTWKRGYGLIRRG